MRQNSEATRGPRVPRDLLAHRLGRSANLLLTRIGTSSGLPLSRIPRTSGIRGPRGPGNRQNPRGSSRRGPRGVPGGPDPGSNGMEPYPRQRRRSNHLGRVSLPTHGSGRGYTPSWRGIPQPGLGNRNQVSGYPGKCAFWRPQTPSGRGSGRGSGEHFPGTFRGQLIHEKRARKPPESWFRV